MNNELERTEELMVQASGKNRKKKLIIIAVIAALLAAGAGIYAGININNDKQVEKQLKIAQASLREGEYEQAIKDFDKVIELDDSNPLAYEGKGDAYVGTDKPEKAIENYKKSIEKDKTRKSPYEKAISAAVRIDDTETANELLDEMKDNIKGNEDVSIETVKAGGNPGNISNYGTVVNDGDQSYIANMKGYGSIGVINNDGDEDVLVEGLKDDGEKPVISGLIHNGDNLYFVTSVPNGSSGSAYLGKSIYRVRTDGSEKPERIFTTKYEMVAPDGSGGGDNYDKPHYLNGQLMIVNDKLVFGGYRTDDIEGYCQINSTDMEGNDYNNIATVSSNTFTTDGENIYAVGLNRASIEMIGADSDNRQELMNNMEQNVDSMVGNTSGQLIYEDGKIYFVEKNGFDGDTRISSFDINSKEKEKIYSGLISDSAAAGADGDTTPKGCICIKGDNLYFTEVTDSNIMNTSVFRCKISKLDLDSGKVSEVGTIEHDFAEEDLKYQRTKGTNVVTYKVNGMCIAGDRIVYELKGTREHNGMISDDANVFGEISLDGKESKEY